MQEQVITKNQQAVGKIASYATFILIIIYAITTIMGFMSLPSPDDPIRDPYFTLMELLIILIVPFMVIVMAVIYNITPPGAKIYSLTALVFMIIIATITSSIHFIVLTIGPQFEADFASEWKILLSFRWPSVVYALDILAWDWFFALSMIFASVVFSNGRLEKTIRILMLISGILSLAGLAGVPLADMQIRNIGIIGYSIVAPVAFLLLGILFSRLKR